MAFGFPRSSSSSPSSSPSPAVADVLAPHLGRVQALMREQLGPRWNTLLEDEAQVERAARLVHPLLPIPVRLVVRQEAFVRFVLQHKDRLRAGA